MPYLGLVEVSGDELKENENTEEVGIADIVGRAVGSTYDSSVDVLNSDSVVVTEEAEELDSGPNVRVISLD